MVESSTLTQFQHHILNQIEVISQDDSYTTWLFYQLFRSLEWIEHASSIVTSDEAYDNVWFYSSLYESQRFFIHKFHIISHWFLFDFISRLASQEMVNQHINRPSDILIRIMWRTHSELLAAIESTYTSFLALHESVCL